MNTGLNLVIFAILIFGWIFMFRLLSFHLKKKVLFSICLFFVSFHSLCHIFLFLFSPNLFSFSLGSSFGGSFLFIFFNF
jgi:hypothetical protein